MKFKNEWLQIISEFVPQGYQATAHNFMYYLKTLTEKRYDIRLYSIAISEKKIQVINYLVGRTDVEVFTFTELERMVQKEYNPELNRTPQYQIMFDQLKNAF